MSQANVAKASDRYHLRVSRSAARSLQGDLPGKVAHAALQFITGPLLDNPYRVGKPLGKPLAPAFSARRGDYRILYLINEDTHTVEVTGIKHRSDAYRAS